MGSYLVIVQAQIGTRSVQQVFVAGPHGFPTEIIQSNLFRSPNNSDMGDILDNKRIHVTNQCHGQTPFIFHMMGEISKYSRG
jgi:hypothetical protein